MPFKSLVVLISLAVAPSALASVIVKSPSGLVAGEHLFQDYYLVRDLGFVGLPGEIIYPNSVIRLEPLRVQAGPKKNWGLQDINAASLQAKADTGSIGRKIKVAIVDTGGCFSHPDLAQAYSGGFNAIDPTLPADDDNGHGCHVSGTIAGPENYGVAGGYVELFAGKFIGPDGTGTIADAIKATSAALDWGAEIVSNSWGGGEQEVPYEDLIKPAIKRGVIFIFAAGNDGEKTASYPASIAGVISVASHDRRDVKSSFSNYGPEVLVSLPGEQILSSWNDGKYKTISGTSMAAPHMAGVASLLLEAGAKPKEILKIIKYQDSVPADWVRLGRVRAP
jgi:subtilisin family serine protease